MYIFDDDEIVLRIIITCRNPTLRHVSWSNGVTLDGQVDSSSDTKIQIRYVDSRNQFAHNLTKGHVKFTFSPIQCQFCGLSMLLLSHGETSGKCKHRRHLQAWRTSFPEIAKRNSKKKRRRPMKPSKQRNMKESDTVGSSQKKYEDEIRWPARGCPSNGFGPNNEFSETEEGNPYP